MLGKDTQMIKDEMDVVAEIEKGIKIPGSQVSRDS